MVALSVTDFNTGRLFAERLQEKHFDQLCRMHQGTKVMATLGGLRSGEQTRDFLDKNLAHWEKQGFGLWMLYSKADGRFAGRGGLRHVRVAECEEIELAYALDSAFWGQGLATEMAEVILKIGSEDLDLSDLVCFTLSSNQASRRVMEKVGFRYERDIIHAKQPHVLYRLTKAVHSSG